MSAQISWQKGGEADLVILVEDRITLRSTVPSAPGSRPEGTLASGSPVKVKVARCRREGELFVIEGRLLDATRAVRQELLALLPPATAD